MMKLRKPKKITLHPIMAFVILILATLVLSSILGAFGLQSNYTIINSLRGNLENVLVTVTPLFNLSGLKLIFRTTVSNFASFAPLSMLLITLIGIGIMDKSGFLESFFALLTKNASKFRVTLTLSFITIIASIAGDMSYIALIPIMALLFKYSHRNPKAGIIMAFAGLTCGTSINIFASSIDSALLEYTTLAAKSLDSAYTISTLGYLFVMILMTIIMSIVVANITEKIIIPKLGKYEVESTEEFYLDKHKKRGLLFSLTVGTVYLLIFAYNIIPGLPLSGNLLDYSQNLYIDKLFGYNSFFNQGFVFIVTMLFFLCGLFYGLGAKTIKNNRDVCSYLGHSLDGIGRTIVLIFFASTLISIVKDSNIGNVAASLLANMISNFNMSGIPLIIITFIVVAIVTLLVPSPVTAWSIMSSTIVPVFMGAGMSAEFANLVFRAGECATYGLTPLMAYFVIYLAFLDQYEEDDKRINLFSSIKNILPYAGATAIIWIVVLILFYIIGLPIGIGTSPVI